MKPEVYWATFKRRIRRCRQWSRAIFWAVIGAMYHRQSGWKRATAFVETMRKVKGRVPVSVALARLRTCSHCPVYDRDMRTCGSFRKTLMLARTERWLGDPAPFVIDAGCHCYMPVKAWLNGATCWLDDVAPESDEMRALAGLYGWKSRLNG